MSDLENVVDVEATEVVEEVVTPEDVVIADAIADEVITEEQVEEYAE